MPIIVPESSATGFSPYYLMYGRQPHLLVDVTLGLAPCTIIEAKHLKIHSEDEGMHAKWSQRKAEGFQAKEVQRHKQNYDIKR